MFDMKIYCKTCFLFLITLNINAEPKSLWCIDNNIDGFVEETITNVEKDAEMAKNAGFDPSKTYKAAKQCSEMLNNPDRQVWYSANEFVFDTQGLQNETFSEVEYKRFFSCGLLDTSSTSLKVKLSSTPTTISFSWTDSSYPYRSKVFNIDRKTLNAGMDDDRYFTCELKDVDTSENVL